MPIPTSHGAVLLDQTMIANAARLLQNVPVDGAFVSYLVEAGLDRVLAEPLAASQRSQPVSQVERLADLSALCDALLLYDKLYVLRCETCLDAGNLDLRAALLNLGIVEEIDAADYGPAIADELVLYLRSVEADAAPGLLADVATAVQGFLADDDAAAVYDRTTVMIDAFRDGIEGAIATPSVAVAEVDPLAAIARQVISEVRYIGSGSLFGAVSNIRTFAYWRLAARLEVPMYPSSRRLPSYQAISRHIDRSLRERAYGAVAQAFQTTVTEVFESAGQTPIYLPPGAAIFLDAMRERQSVTQSLVDMRSQFQSLRDAFRKLQQDSATTSTLAELRQHQLRFASVLNELRTPSGAGSAGLETAIDLLPEVAHVAANPLDLSAYSDNLIKKPALWIQDWWRRRPYRLVFKFRDRLMEIADYPHLLRDVTGVQISEPDLREYVAGHRDDGQYQQARRPNTIATAVDT